MNDIGSNDGKQGPSDQMSAGSQGSNPVTGGGGGGGAGFSSGNFLSALGGQGAAEQAMRAQGASQGAINNAIGGLGRFGSSDGTISALEKAGLAAMTHKANAIDFPSPNQAPHWLGAVSEIIQNVSRVD